MKASGRPIVNAFKRAYTAQAQAAKSAEKVALNTQAPKVTKLGNGAIALSLENNSPVSRVAVVYNAGPRYEPLQQKGITHCVRSAINLSNEKSSSFGLTRNIEQIGGSLNCTATREQLVYSVTCLRDSIDVGAEFLSHVTQPSFKPWEIEEANARTQHDLDLYAQSPELQLGEAIHAAAYRSGLSNSIYAPSHKVGTFSPDQLHSFVSNYFTSSNMAVVGLGVSDEQLQIIAKDIAVNNAAAPAIPKSVYSGAQVRIESNSPLVHAAVVTEGVGLGSSDLLALYVLQKVMGSGSYVKYGSGLSASKVAKAAAQGASKPFSAACINSTYSDTGLFGFQVVGHASEMDKVLKSVATSFGEATKGSITDADVQRAKNQLKAAFMMGMENADDVLLDYSVQTVLSGQVFDMDALSAAIDAITTAEVQNVAKKVINGKPAMAAVGDLYNTPYLEDLY